MTVHWMLHTSSVFFRKLTRQHKPSAFRQSIAALVSAVVLSSSGVVYAKNQNAWQALRGPQLAEPSGTGADVGISTPTAVKNSSPPEQKFTDGSVAAAKSPESVPEISVPELKLPDVSSTAVAGNLKHDSDLRQITEPVTSDSGLPWFPVLDPIQPVSFAVSVGQHNPIPAFAGSQMPFLGVRTDPADSADPAVSAQSLFGSEEELHGHYSSQEGVHEVPSGEHRSFVNELQTLIGEDPSTKADGSYLADLNQLLGRKSDWIMTNGMVLDLDPHAPAATPTSESYLHDLQQLVQGPVASRSDDRNQLAQRLVAMAARSTTAQQAPQIPAAPPRYYEVPPRKDCVAVGGDVVGNLFSPVASLQVAGGSSTPPSVPQAAPEAALKLELPVSKACDYLEVNAPGYYFAGGYGFRPAPRNTHRFSHNPLYFEDPNLERCGQGHGCLTTAHSAAHFVSLIAITPYLMTADHPRSCVAALPDCRTCQSFGKEAYLPEWSWKAAAVQAAAVTGLVFIIP